MWKHREPVVVHVCDGLEGQLHLHVGRNLDEGPAGPEGTVQGGEPGASGGDRPVQLPLQQLGMVPQRVVDALEVDAHPIDVGIGPGQHRRRVVLKREAGPISDLAGRLQEPEVYLVQVVGPWSRGVGLEGEIEVAEVGISPLLGLRGGHGQGLELAKGPGSISAVAGSSVPAGDHRERFASESVLCRDVGHDSRVVPRSVLVDEQDPPSNSINEIGIALAAGTLAPTDLLFAGCADAH